MTNPLAEALNQLVTLLESLRIRFVIVGSLAAAAHAVVHAPDEGADILAELHPGMGLIVRTALGAGWYADREMTDTAIRDGGVFNLIHRASALKVDVFTAAGEYHATELNRAVPITLFFPEGTVTLPMASAEDVLLNDLQAYGAGNGLSERLWNNILGMLLTGPQLDFEYLRSWAARLRVSDLLSRAMADAARANS